MGTEAHASHAPHTSPTSPSASPRSRLQRVERAIITVLLAVWAVWAALILLHPVRKESVDDLKKAIAAQDVKAWVTVEPDQGLTFSPSLADPVTQEWKETVPDWDGNTPTFSSDTAVAWRDSHGVHVTPTFEGSGADDGGDGAAMADPAGTLYHQLSKTPGARQAADMRDLWTFGALKVGNTTIMPLSIIAFASLLSGLFSLWSNTPRFRTRWSWFWIFGAPLGVGFVWYLLREGWFGNRPAPERRASGWTGIGWLILLSVTVGPAVMKLIAR